MQELLEPHVQENVRGQLKRKQNIMKFYHDQNAHNLPQLYEKEPIRVYQNKQWEPATVTAKLPHRSYEIVTPAGQKYRRTRTHLKKTFEQPFPEEQEPVDPEPEVEPKSIPMQASRSPEEKPTSPEVVKTRIGRVVKPPKRLDW